MAKREETEVYRQPDIDSVLNLDKLAERAYKPADLLGIPLIYLDSTMKAGRNGDYLVMDVQIETSGEQVSVATGAAHVMNVVKALRASGTRNVRFAFAQNGNRYMIVKAPML